MVYTPCAESGPEGRAEPDRQCNVNPRVFNRVENNMTNIIINYAGLLLGILSILATIYFALKYAERKEPRFYSLNESKIAISKDTPADIQIMYKGQKVMRVSSTLIWFWNAGKRPINKEDIPAGQPLLVNLSEPERNIEILDVAIRKTSREAINFRVTKCDTSTVELNFDFLDHNDGAAIEIQHTGTLEATVTISGIILGASKGIEMMSKRSSLSDLVPGRHYYSQARRPSKIFRLFFTFIIIAILGGVSLFVLNVGKDDITTSRKLLRTALEKYLSGESVDSAIQAVVTSAKYQTINKVAPYIFVGFLILGFIAFLILYWRSPVAFPNALLIDEPIRKVKKTDEQISTSNQGNQADAS